MTTRKFKYISCAAFLVTISLSVFAILIFVNSSKNKSIKEVAGDVLTKQKQNNSEGKSEYLIKIESEDGNSKMSGAYPGDIAGRSGNDGTSIKGDKVDNEDISKNYQKLANGAAQKAQLTPGTSLKFDHAEISENSIRYIYKKIFDEPRKELPDSIIVIVDRHTSQAEILIQD